MWFCKKKCSKSRYNLPTKVVAVNKWSKLNITRNFEPKNNRSLVKESLAEIVDSCSKLLFCKVTRETTQKGPTSNVKFYPLHLSQAKNLLDPGLILDKIQRRGFGLFFPSNLCILKHLNVQSTVCYSLDWLALHQRHRASRYQWHPSGRPPKPNSFCLVPCCGFYLCWYFCN